jgi:AraC-like DNA-binding protein
VGFSSLKTFNRTFARREAVTPQRFRQRERTLNGEPGHLNQLSPLIAGGETAA